MSVTIQLRGDEAANWTATNPVLNAREPGIETDTGRIKWGDGATSWSALPYWSGGTFDGSGQALVGVAPAVVSIADNTAVAVDASTGNYFRVLLTTAVGATRTINAPSNAADGQLAVFELIQPASGGPLSVTWASGAGGFSFGTGSAPALNSGSSSSTLVTFRYSGAQQAWECITSGGSSGLAAVATTGTAGYALSSSAGTILSWTAPNDGQPHRVDLTCSMHVTSAETGGEIDWTFVMPDGTSVTSVPYAASLAVSTPGFSGSRMVGPGTTVTVTQTALTAGAATLWAQIWAA